ncbi:MAG: PemK family protein [Bryobacterales bacterium]|nr:PemK family protein [Bryobacterales bacterium]
MKPGDVVLIRLAQVTGGPPKLRPALVLALLPGPYQNVLICGISTQLHRLEPGWDELIQPSDSDFALSGLHSASAVRLSYLYAAERAEISGSIGFVDPARLTRLRSRLAKQLA